MRTTQRNYPLFFGICLSLIVVGLAIFGPALAPHDPLQEFGAFRVKGIFYGPPPLDRALPPFRDVRFPLGTDQTMRDVLSRLLWAVRPTLLLCAVVTLVRVGVGTLLGLVAGWFGGVVARVIDGLISASLSVPLLALAVAVLLALGLGGGLVPFVIALSITGWCDTATLVKTRTQAVRHAPYIESARAIGRRTGGLLWRHVLPQLRPIVPMILAFELAAVLLLVAELGYLGYYLGGGSVFTFSIGNTDRQFFLRTGTPELGQMLSDFFRSLYRAPWVPIFAGSIVFLSLAAFSLLGEGLRRRLDVTRPRRARWWQRAVNQRPVETVARRWTVGGAAVLIAGALLVAWSVIAAPKPSPTPDTSLFSTMPVAAAQLTALDLEALVAQPGVLPEGLEVGQVSPSVPDLFRDVPQPAQTRSFTIRRVGLNAASVSILLYPAIEPRDTAFGMMTEALIKQYLAPNDPLPSPRAADFQVIAGERAFTPQPSLGERVHGQTLFVRCGAIVLVRFDDRSTPSWPNSMTTLAQSLDARLTPLVCQPSSARQTASSAPTFSTTPVSVEQLDAVDLRALVTQPSLLPTGYTVFQVSERVPDEFRSVPTPVKVSNATLKRGNVNTGNVLVLLYPLGDQRDQAYQKIVERRVMNGLGWNPNEPMPQPPYDGQPVVAGERSFVVSSGETIGGIPGSGVISTPSHEIVFIRCGAVVQVRLTGSAPEGLAEGAESVATSLDAQLAPQVCQGQ